MSKACPKRDKNDDYEKITVIIETKGCWNKELWDAMENQLKNRYLKNNQSNSGLYLVGRFDCPQWDKKDSRKNHLCKLTNEEILGKLQNKAELLSKEDILIKPFVLNASLPSLT